MDIINSFVDGSVTFGSLGEWFGGIFASATAEGSAAARYFEIAKNWLESVTAGFVWAIPAVLVLLSLIQVFAGKKLLGLQKFLASFVAGFALGAALVTPLISGLGVQIEDWIVGLVVGIIAALLCKLVYFLAYVIAAGAATYTLCVSGILPEVISNYSKDMIVAIVATVVVIVLALVLRKFIEMLGTAALGGWTLVLSIEALIAAFMPEFACFEQWLFFVIMGVAALVGFIVQVATRKRY
ncbi:MAG: hypothetical protein J6Q85_06475 [Clostridia bacterium]|nr:hypothetical protein [Clostridia bacterium]